jgi:uncharacterized membrane protein
MKLNEGTTDRIIRVVAGAVLAGVGGFAVSGVLSIVLVVLGAILILTGAVGVCPAYMPFKFSTVKK